MNQKLKRYLLFAGSSYYPAGGWGDFVGSYDTLEEAKAASAARKYDDWTEIADSETGLEIEATGT